MTRFGIGADVALRLAAERYLPRAPLVAPTLLRTDVLATLYAAVRRGEMDRAEADARLDHVRALKIRLLGDRVLQRVAWRIAAERDWPDTRAAEYLAVTQLQADVFVTLDPALAAAAEGIVPVAGYEALPG